MEESRNVTTWQQVFQGGEGTGACRDIGTPRPFPMGPLTSQILLLLSDLVIVVHIDSCAYIGINFSNFKNVELEPSHHAKLLHIHLKKKKNLHIYISIFLIKN